MKVLAIDPGTHIGLAWWEDGMFDSETLGPAYGQKALGVFQAEYQMVSVLFERVVEGAWDLIICEDFILQPPDVRGGWNAKREGLSPVRVTALLLCMLMECGYEEMLDIFRFQMSSQISSCTSQRLRKASLWKVGADDHQRDAAKHLWVFLFDRGLV